MLCWLLRQQPAMKLLDHQGLSNIVQQAVPSHGAGQQAATKH